MKRAVLAALGVCTVLALAMLPAALGVGVGPWVRGVVVALHQLEGLGAGPAMAQETLEFKVVPEESLEASPRIRSERDAERRVKSGDIMRVGSDIEIEEDQVVLGDVLAIRGDVTVAGEVEGNVVAMGGDVYLESTARVGGDVVCMGGRLHEEPGATVGGQRVTALDPDGRRSRTGPRIRVDPSRDWDYDWDRPHVGDTIVKYLILLGLVWLLARVAPGSTGAALGVLKSRPAQSLGVGFLVALLAVPSLIALCLVVVILCITIIGIPLAIIALLGYFVFFAVLVLWGYTVGAAALGERLLARRGETSVSVVRAALSGVILLGSAALFGDILGWLDRFLPLVGILGKVLHAIVALTTIVVIAMGGGAWLHAEFTTGTLGRWWRGSSRRFRGPGSTGGPDEGPVPPGPAGPAGGPPPPASPPPPQPPPPSPPPPAAGGGEPGSGGAGPAAPTAASSA